MIIWLNGAFGAGKTETAYELQRRIPRSFIFDPEYAGLYIRSSIPDDMKKDDFQDFTEWRTINYTMLRSISGQYKGTIIVPMTIVNPQYLDEIIGRLQKDGIAVKHFILGATREVLLGRLIGRGDDAHSWPAQQIDRCVAGLSEVEFGIHLDTCHMTIDEVASQILEHI